MDINFGRCNNKSISRIEKCHQATIKAFEHIYNSEDVEIIYYKRNSEVFKTLDNIGVDAFLQIDGNIVATIDFKPVTKGKVTFELLNIAYSKDDIVIDNIVPGWSVDANKKTDYIVFQSDTKEVIILEYELLRTICTMKYDDLLLLALQKNTRLEEKKNINLKSYYYSDYFNRKGLVNDILNSCNYVYYHQGISRFHGKINNILNTKRYEIYNKMQGNCIEVAKLLFNGNLFKSGMEYGLNRSEDIRQKIPMCTKK